MAMRRGAAEGSDKGPNPNAAREAIDLTINYVRQQTLDPLKSLGRFIGYGTLGSLAIAIGAVLWLIAILRLLQTETGAFHGNLSWVPYLIVAALAIGLIALAVWRISAGPATRRRPEKETTE
jgi:hypothetical protein